MREPPKAALKRLRKVLTYKPRKGVFVWKVKRNSRAGSVMPGDVAGTKGPGRVELTVDGCRYRVHILAFLFMTGKWPPKGIEVDHENGKDNDNRWTNLRLATKAQNMWNTRKLYATNKSGKRGVSWVARDCKWLARITVNKHMIELGAYASRIRAIKVRRAAEFKYYGEYAPI